MRALARARLWAPAAWKRVSLAWTLLLVACVSRSNAPYVFNLVSIRVGQGEADLGRVEQALEALPGVLEVQLDPTDDRVDVAYDSARANREGLLAAIRGLGYQAEVVIRRKTLGEIPAPEPSVEK